MDKNQIRNFSIIAHIDHGKSTLSDRLIQQCQGLSDREMKQQVLDSMDIERERGITIKSQAVTLTYKAQDGKDYQLNFIDTPGHVDFSYEVSRSLCACEGALLVVDAAQGVEAQTMANCYTAIAGGLEVLPVLNKIDLPAADPENVIEQIEDLIGLDAMEADRVSAKTGVGIDNLLETLVRQIPPPQGDKDAPLKALIIDSWFDKYNGVISLVRIFDGQLSTGDTIEFMSTGQSFKVDEIGFFTPKKTAQQTLSAGQTGYVIAGVKDIFAAPVGDTLTLHREKCLEPISGFMRVQPKVFAGMFPTATDEFENFRDALLKLQINDASLSFEPESSTALGFGFRCGFLGLLHMEIIQERLEREFDIDLITTAPTVVYKVYKTNEQCLEVESPSQLPSVSEISRIEEPLVEAHILTPSDYIGDIMSLCTEKRGWQKDVEYRGSQVTLKFMLPLSEVVLDFFDRLKSSTKGYASFDYEMAGYQESKLVKLDILINGEVVDALAVIVHKEQAQRKGRALVEKLQEVIPRQMFDVAIQAALGNQIIARATVKAFRKNVTAKCYGGDISRKRKLLEKQKEGKKRMKQVGRVEIPQEAFLALLKVDQSK